MNRFFIASFIVSAIGNVVGALPVPQYVKGIVSAIALVFVFLFLLPLIITVRQRVKDDRECGCGDE
jgi:hypothetical protein